jgi:hypothetical protein
LALGEPRSTGHGIRRVDHYLTRRSLIRGNVGQKPGPRGNQVLHPVGAHVARQHVLDLSDLAADHLQPHGDDQLLVPLFHHAVEGHLARGRIHRVDLETRGCLGRPYPQPFADLDLGRVLGIAHALGQRQAGRIVFDHRGQIAVDQSGPARAIAGIRRLRPRAGYKHNQADPGFHATDYIH